MDEQQNQSLWTPEIIMQAFKEIVAAILGLLLVAYTLVIANHSITLTGNEAEITHAKDVLQLMLGLAGVVVGYYFGRVPADARAAQANKKAMAATIQAERVSSKGEQIANQLDELFTANAVSTRSLESDAEPTREEVQRLRDELRELATLTRER